MRSLFALLALAGAWLCVSCAGLTEAGPPPFVLGEPAVLRYETQALDHVTLVINAWERTYAVPGTSATEVGANLAALRRAGTGHGPYSASTRWDLQIGLRYAHEPAGCRISAATVELMAVITMPALEEPETLEDGELARWELFVANLLAHELEHLDNQVEGARSLQARLRDLPMQASCRDAGEAANALAESQERSINATDQALDARTEHGALTGATFP